MNKLILLIISIGILFVACENNDENAELPIARVYDRYLYYSDINSAIPPGILAEDSLKLVKNIIDDWVKKQLMLKKAELNLTEEDTKDIDKQIQDYRTSLMIFKYNQQLVQQKLDTVISEEEIEKYYNQYSGNFVLNKDIVKLLFIKLPIQSPDVIQVKTWYRSTSDENMARLEDYCYQYAVKYDNFNNSWVNFLDILKELPVEVEDVERFLKYRKYIETEDSSFIYLVRIDEYKLKSETQPLEVAKPKIKSILLNKRKFAFIEDLENRIYNDALNHNDFTIY